MSSVNPSNYPKTPVNPVAFTQNVVTQLNQFGVVVSNDTPKVIGELCGLLNYSITNPNVSKGLQSKNIWAFPAQTGIGKSVSLCIYVAMLNQEASLIVVNTVDEAKEYCENINSVKGSHYANCLYSPRNKMESSFPYLVEDEQSIKQSQCLVITHNRLKQVLTSADADAGYVKNYEYNAGMYKSRELIVIDEQLSFYSSTNLDYKRVKNLLVFQESQLTNLPASKFNYYKLKKQIQLFRKIIDYLDSISIADGEYEYIYDQQIITYLRGQFCDPKLDLDFLEDSISEAVNFYFKQMKLISDEKSDPYKKELSSKLKQLIKEVKRVLVGSIEDEERSYKAFLIYNAKNKKCLLSVSNIYNKLGTCVVLDATANVDAFYKFANKGIFSRVELVKAPLIRKYDSLTIHKAIGYKQSKYSLFQKEGAADENAKMYLSYANSILKGKDKLLIIGHKDFISTLSDSCSDQRIVFTHWGMHVGHNHWSDCNKVMIVGWNYLPLNATLSSIFSTGIGTDDLMIHRALKNRRYTVEDFSISQIADDLIQGIMRCRARVIATKDSDCTPADVYLFHDNTPKSIKVLDIVEGAFPHSKKKMWKPLGYKPTVNKGGIPKNVEKIIACLKANVTLSNPMTRRDIESRTGLQKGAVHRAITHSGFSAELEKVGIKEEKKNGSTDQFVLT